MSLNQTRPDKTKENVINQRNAPPAPERAHTPAREADDDDKTGIKLEWVHEAADLMLPVLEGVNRETLTQTLADAQVYGTGIRGKRRYEPAVFVGAAKQFGEALQSKPLESPGKWWAYFVAILNGVSLGGEAKDAGKAAAESRGAEIQRMIAEQRRLGAEAYEQIMLDQANK